MQGEVLYVPDRRQLRLMTLGYDQTAADLVWVRTLEYFASHFKGDRRYPWLEHFLEQIISLDPDFTKVYHWAGANVLYGRRFTNENVERSNHFYALALKRDPDDFEAAYRLGLNYYVELKSDDSEQRRKWREQGLSYLDRAANTPWAPTRVRNLVASISSRLGKKQIALQYLVDLYVQTSDPIQRDKLKLRIEAIQKEIGRSAGPEDAVRFEADRKKHFAYLSPALFSILGEPHRQRIGDKGWRDLVKTQQTSHNDEQSNLEETQQ